MGFVPKYLDYVLSVIVMLLPALCYSQDSFTRSRATYYSSRDGLGTPTGACGFGEYGRTVNDANVAGVSRLWKNGMGCGACYQVRCKMQQLCKDEGVYVVATDYGEGDRTDFILSSHAYGGMARADASSKLFAYGVVDVEFRRVPCRFNGDNILYKIHEASNFPHYLAMVILYVPGQYDVAEVQIWREDDREWVAMRRAYGSFFDNVNIPYSPVYLRYGMRSNSGLTWAEAKNAVPTDLKAGVTYESAIQLE